MGFFGSDAYKPKTSKNETCVEEIGWVRGEFEAFEPRDPKLFKDAAKGPNHQYPQVSPITPSEHVPIDQITRRLIETLWKRAEPATGAKRGDLQIGRAVAAPARGAAPAAPGDKPPPGRRPGALPETRDYKPHVVPFTSAGTAQPTFIDDWGFMDRIPRTDAFTFRGDARGPAELLSKAGGFWPPSSRTDRAYLEGAISDFFISYMDRRYGQTVTKQQFLLSVDQVSSSSYAKQMLVDYMMWRKIMEGESFHLGRMLVQECLKGYISTSRNPHTAVMFGSNYRKRDCWVYITEVHGGFKVPASQAKWGTAEQEIAQWGPIPSDRILGFRKTTNYGVPLSQIYMRRSFRKKEPKAFEAIFNIWSGDLPTHYS